MKGRFLFLFSVLIIVFSVPIIYNKRVNIEQSEREQSYYNYDN